MNRFHGRPRRAPFPALLATLPPILALVLALALALSPAPPADAQEADPPSALPALPETPDDAVEVRVQEELDAASRRIEATLATTGAAAAGDGEAVEVDLTAAVDLALARNPALRAVEEQRDEVKAGVREVKADAYPQLAATSAYTVSRNPAFLNSPDFEDILDQFPGGDFRPSEQRLYSGGIEVSQPVYTFGKIRAAIDLARLLVDATEAQIGAARLDTALAAALAYYDVLAAREALSVGVVQHRVRREALEVVRARYEIGEATRLELLRAQSAVAEVTPEIARRVGDLDVARSDLRNVLGLPADVRLTVTGGLPVVLPAVGELPEDGAATPSPAADRVPGRPAALPPVPELAVLWSTARANRPEIADLELQAEALQRRQVVTRAGGRPQVELNGFYGREARLYENLDEGLFDNYSVALSLRWEFFDGGRRKGQIAQLESQRRQLGHQLRDLLDAIQLELEQAVTSYRTARERWLAAETAATAAREASRVARVSYREGVALQTDWLDAQRQETEAEIVAVEAYYEARREASRLARALGAYPTRDDLTGRPAAGGPAAAAATPAATPAEAGAPGDPISGLAPATSPGAAAGAPSRPDAPSDLGPNPRTPTGFAPRPPTRPDVDPEPVGDRNAGAAAERW